LEKQVFQERGLREGGKRLLSIGGRLGKKKALLQAAAGSAKKRAVSVGGRRKLAERGPSIISQTMGMGKKVHFCRPGGSGVRATRNNRWERDGFSRKRARKRGEGPMYPYLKAWGLGHWRTSCLVRRGGGETGGRFLLGERPLLRKLSCFQPRKIQLRSRNKGYGGVGGLGWVRVCGGGVGGWGSSQKG